ncbi:hypothetical protein NLJ89_g8717 [Agrocybe chaxingu]|uniref:TERF2-interacting telomeric protein 1 Myb domain-containing protein n=1 Tax=Agrocybe chaxingu TaxID=84603 RepID=A0A9W8JUP5_9AGAR|nr:hypothetical protein NLJ89_g8717 [Agrocybe chaxingu]
MALSRNPYTESDDENLVRYIAKHNPGGEGRQGNKLYQNLQENASGKWPWAKRHPWSSWRERYKKNQVYFDRKIKRELKRQAEGSGKNAEAGPSKVVARPLTKKVEVNKAKALPAKQRAEAPAKPQEDVVEDSQSEDEQQGPVGSDDYTRELFGSFVEDSEEPQRSSSSSPPSSVAPQPRKERQPPPPVPSQEPTPPKSDAVTPVRVLPQPKKLKRKAAQDDDPFETPPSSPNVRYPAPTTRGAPPIYVEGPFRTTIKRPRTVSNDVEAWPPKRLKKDPPSQTQQLAARKPGHRRLPAQILPVASSSKVKLPETSNAAPQPPPQDVFESPRSEAKGKGRVAEKTPRRVDLRRESMHAVRRSRGGSRSSTVTADSSAVVRRTPGFSATQDTLFALFKSNLHRLGDEYGFSKGVVEQTYRGDGAAERALHEAMPHLFLRSADVEMGYGTDEEQEPEGVVPVAESKLSSAASSPRNGSRRRSGPRRSLTIKPAPPNDDDRMSDYSPPNTSRAGQYARLVRQGRKEEALARESRRVSGVFVPYTQEKPRMLHQPDLPSTNPSPTPAARQPAVEALKLPVDPPTSPQAPAPVADDDDYDDFYVTDNEQEQADDEFEPEQEQEPSSQPALQSPPRAQQIRRSPRDNDIVEEAAHFMSESPERDQRSKIEPTSDEEMFLNDDLKKLQDEHRRLSLTVNEENADVMRALEKKVDRLTVKSWSLAVLEEHVQKITMAADAEMEYEGGVAGEEGDDEMEDHQVRFIITIAFIVNLNRPLMGWIFGLGFKRQQRKGTNRVPTDRLTAYTERSGTRLLKPYPDFTEADYSQGLADDDLQDIMHIATGHSGRCCSFTVLWDDELGDARFMISIFIEHFDCLDTPNLEHLAFTSNVSPEDD